MSKREPACAVAAGAVCAVGSGAACVMASARDPVARVFVAHDDALSRAGLVRPRAARAPADLGIATGDRATDLLTFALREVAGTLDRVRPAWRAERIGVALGTSSGGMLSAERFFVARDAGDPTDAELARASTYFGPFEAALASIGLAAAAPRTQVLAACAASTVAIGLGLRWLDRDACDLVLAGGYNGVGAFVAAGFEALRATTATVPRPFRVGRDGMALGEGAGVVALVRASQRTGAPALFFVRGFGASTDAVHITAPDRTGAGLARAASQALADAGAAPRDVGLVSAHATATPYNDAMESRALATVFLGAEPPIVHPFKAQIGHTLGAAGVLEALAAAGALAAGVAPASAGEGELDADAPVRLLAHSESRPLAAALKLSAAFGGTNAALVLGAVEATRPERAARPVFVSARVHVRSADLGELVAATGIPRDRLARLDPLCRLGVAAVAALAASVRPMTLEGAGIVAGHGLATLETNAGYDARRRARGGGAADPRLFPATSPNAIAGEAAIAFRLTGPSFSVGASLDGGREALAAAAELVAAGDVDRMVVLAADDAGPAGRALLAAIEAPLSPENSQRPFESGAVAVLLTSEGAVGAEQVHLGDLWKPVAGGAIGHLGLLG